MNINILFGLILCSIGIIYLNNYYIQTNQINKSKQISHIIPLKNQSVSNIQPIKQHDEIIDFLFSIQDLYIYNPQEYINLVNSIDNFFNSYEIILLNTNTNDIIDTNYTILDNQKRNAMNSLQNISFNIEPNKHIDKKIQKAIITLDFILTKYMNHVIELHKDNIYKNGYTNNTFILPDKKIKPYNTYYDNNLFTSYLY